MKVLAALIATLGVGAILAGILLLIVWPLVTIWGLNTLFALGIPYTFWTWLAGFVLIMTFGNASLSVSFKN